MNKVWLFGTGIVIGLALVLTAGWVLLTGNYQYNGVVIDPPATAVDFTLTDQHGQPYTLSEQRGKMVLIFFGYTNCPDVCPITLSEFKRVKAVLGEQADRVEFVYITVDPERDTVERIAQYLPNFDPEFVGLSGSVAEMEPVWQAYGVYREKQDTGSAAGYLVDHSTRTYLIDAGGNWRINFPYGMEPEKIGADLLHLLKEDQG
jgi:protein SCO1/2